jgi:hypothetical protein
MQNKINTCRNNNYLKCNMDALYLINFAKVVGYRNLQRVDHVSSVLAPEYSEHNLTAVLDHLAMPEASHSAIRSSVSDIACY